MFAFIVEKVTQYDQINGGFVDYVFDDMQLRDARNAVFKQLKYMGIQKIKNEHIDTTNSEKRIYVNYEDFDVSQSEDGFPYGVIQMYFNIALNYLFNVGEKPDLYFRDPHINDCIYFKRVKDGAFNFRIRITGIEKKTTQAGVYAGRVFYNVRYSFEYQDASPGSHGWMELPQGTSYYQMGTQGDAKGNPGFGGDDNTYNTIQRFLGDNFSDNDTRFGLQHLHFPFVIRSNYYNSVTSKATLINAYNTYSYGVVPEIKVNPIMTSIQMTTTYTDNFDYIESIGTYNGIQASSGVENWLSYGQKVLIDYARNASFVKYTCGWYAKTCLNDIAYVNQFTTWKNTLNSIETIDEIPDIDYGFGDDSTTGGGGGDFDNSSDNVGYEAPPSYGALSTGFVKMYRVSESDLSSLRDLLWSDNFIDGLKKLFNDPSQAIISLQQTYAPVSSGVSENITIGNFSTNIQGTKITQQYYTVDFGTINIKEYWGNFLDYSPNTKLSIYLPFIGIRQLDINNFMSGVISLKYSIDACSGCCVASISTIKDGINSIIYTHTGNCNIEIPWSSANFIQWQLKMVEAGLSLSAAAASGGSGFLGAATMGSLVTSTANSVLSEHSNVSVSGSLASTNGALGVKYPYLILNRPIQSHAKNYNKYKGLPSNITSKLSGLSGYTKVEEIHLENIHNGEFYAESEEIEEIENILKSGVII